MRSGTHASYGQGQIDDDRARAEGQAEAGFVDVVLRSIASTTPQNEAAADHVLKIESQAQALTEWVDPEEGDLGADATLAAITPICNSLQGRMDAIIADARTSGLSEASLDALAADVELNELIEDLYNLTIFGR